MSPDSEFPRIVLIKSFGSDCIEDVKSKLGRYTHIQSYNGVFLDGMDIKDVTAIFQSMRSPIAYLTVRYIHPSQSAMLSQQRTKTPICKPEAPRLDPLMGEELPIPLYILGDIHSYSEKLFELLKEETLSKEELLPKEEASSNEEMDSDSSSSGIDADCSVSDSSSVEEEADSPVSGSSTLSVAAGAVAMSMSEVSTQISFTARLEKNLRGERADLVGSLGAVARGGS